MKFAFLNNKSIKKIILCSVVTACVGALELSLNNVYAATSEYGKVRPFAQVQGQKSTTQHKSNRRAKNQAKAPVKSSTKNSQKKALATNKQVTNKKTQTTSKNSFRASQKSKTTINNKKNSSIVAPLSTAMLDNPVSDGYISYDAQALERRQAYVEARDLARSGNVDGVEKYKQGVLKNYPLNIYLDYYLLQSNVSVENLPAALSFIREDQDHELSLLLSDLYADKMGALGNFSKVLEIMGKEPHPNSTPEQLNVKQKARECRWHEASLMQNKGSEAAVAFASKLFVGAQSYPEACSGLIAAWASKGYMTNATKARRFQNLLTRKRVTLDELITAAQSLEGEEGQSALAVTKIYSTPENYAELSDRRAKVLGFERYASLNPQDASMLLDALEKDLELTSTERHEILQIIAQERLGSQSTEDDLKWVDENLPTALWSENIIEKRLRRALWFKQWKYVVPLVDALGQRGIDESNWQYWKGRALTNTGHKQEGFELLRKVAKDRSFFGYSAAQLMGVHPHYGNISLKRSDKLPDTLADTPAVQRFFELYAMNDAARFIEWREIATHTDDATALAMAEWALRTGNHQLAISAVTAAERWDALDYRFPQSYLNLYKSHAATSGVPLSYLYGISRQESMLNPVVRSPVGAVGLMQLMPATAQLVAKKQGWRYMETGSLTDPDTNIRYGAAYLASLLSKFNGNRVLASAAYNAGPGRVVRWSSKDGVRRDAGMFIENIPFRETRIYVQRVLLYTAIYEKLINGRNANVLSERERNFNY